ncbi:MAG: F0F1 ATP synthase subunit A [Rhizobiaceae bacterium]|nr:F0F1 ATP synthase subunit A [Rhizobiaceae bacterium]
MATHPDPIKQFAINKLLPLDINGVDLSFTNSSLFMVATVVLTSAYFLWSTGGRGMVPTRSQSVSEIVYEFVAGMLRDSAGSSGMKFFPFVFSLFMFILIINMFGMFPYFLTVTAHIIITIALAMAVFLTVLVVGFGRHGVGFLKLFVPSGVPMLIMPLVIAIEIISFIARPISHSVRLFANMLAGHITLKVFAGFIVSLSAMGTVGIVGSILPFAMTVGMTALEFLVAFLQAYVFTMLTCMYINDALHPGGH